MSDPDQILRDVETAFDTAFGPDPARASISFVGVERIEVLRFRTEVITSYVTLGMSRRPMTSADQLVVTDDGPRAELLVQSRGDAGELWRQLAVLAAAPAVEGVVYREHMTVDLGRPLLPASSCTGGILVGSALATVSSSVGDVQVLRLLPATQTELAWTRVRGAAAMLQRWDELGTDLLDLARGPASLAD